jgi:hypothetical protein
MSCVVILLNSSTGSHYVSQCKTGKIAQENRDGFEETIVIFGP